MGLWNIFAKKKPEAQVDPTPPVALQSLPIEINPSPSMQLLRNIGRLRQLLHAMENGDARPAIASEAKRRQGALLAAGLDIVTTSADAHALLKQLEN